MQSEKNQLSILLVEDDDDHADLLEEQLRSVRGLRKPQFCRSATLEAAKNELLNQEFSVILLDLGLPDSGEKHPLEIVNELAPQTPIIVITALNDEQTSDEAIQSGAQDYITKETMTGDLVYRSIRYAIERKQKLIELQRQNEDLSAFARAASHDLRSPLGNLKSIGNMLAEEIPEPHDPTIEELLQLHGKVANRLETLISDILRFSRLGAKAIQAEEFTLSAAVADVRELLRQNIEVSEATIVEDNSLPVFADKGLTVTILQNLIGNSIKYVRDHKPEIAINSKKEGRWITTCVKDNGIGIPTDCLSKIFAPLQRAVAGSEFEGSGLGLATVKRLVEAHTGRVWVESTEGEGSSFYFTLPAPS